MSEAEVSQRKTYKKDKLLFLVIYLILPISFYLKHITVQQMIYLGILTSVLVGFSLFLLMEMELEEKDFKHSLFYEGYLAGCFAAILFPFLPAEGWPFPVIALILILNTNTAISMFTYSLFIVSAVIMAGADLSILILYFVSGMSVIVFFRRTDEEYKIGIPVLLSIIVMVVMFTARIMIRVDSGISVEAFMIPLINIFITILLFLLYLKYFSMNRMHRYRDKYMEMNDQEYFLIVELKKKSREAYFHAIHTAYFCDKSVNKIGGNRNLTRAGGYFHRISDYWGVLTKAEYEEKMKNYDFPPELCLLLLDYQDKNKKLIGKEETIVYFSDTVVTAIMYLIKKNPDVEIDYEKIIRAIFQKKIESGILIKSEITLSQLYILQNMFIEEKLYYDFLR